MSDKDQTRPVTYYAPVRCAYPPRTQFISVPYDTRTHRPFATSANGLPLGAFDLWRVL